MSEDTPRQVVLARVDPEDERRFAELAAEWKRDRPKGADLVGLCSTWAYQRIIGMGDRALPHILAALKREPDHWFWALYAITGANPVPVEDEGRLTRMAEAWLQWGRRQGYAC